MTTNATTEWWQYVESLMRMRQMQQSDVAEAIDVTPGVLGQWKRGGGTTPERARAVAIAFNRPVSEAFARAGFASEEELGYKGVSSVDVQRLTNDQLIVEINRRLRPNDEVQRRGDAEPESDDVAPKTGKVVRRAPGRR